MSSRTRIQLRFAFALVTLLCLWIAVPMSTQVISAWRQARASGTWPKAPGHMISGSIAHPSGRPRDYTLEFRYEFNVAGKRIEGTQINAGDVIDTARFADLQERYGAGRAVSVSFDPTDPSRCVLEPGLTTGHRFLFLAPPVVFGMAALFGWAAWRGI